ncbi:PEP-CTERM sorting domain-containing protein [Herbaspirillum frisingense]|uniref:FxDxF family PEP-CTERM protein n=1 Tax=Herbaspirillum frisingense TaxID=92645 RepID=UPI001601FFF5|nr:FxDxF family PEP-CTERM protein [Herbaspirillum frisingense]QNB07246.1 PEP-CTERM sorting domain-containing protein [Herbaspirillum frisingense]
MKKLLAASAVALALSMAGTAAHADVTTLTLVHDQVGFSASHTGAFSDTYNFTISNLSDLSSSVTASIVTRSNTAPTTLTSFLLTNIATGATYASSSSTSITTTNGVKKYETNYGILATSLAAGLYKLTVTGNGSYGGNLTLISSVPEASTTSMMLGGLAFVGMMGWRRRRGDQKLSMPMGMTAA